MISADGRHLDKTADSLARGGISNRLGTIGLYCLETLAAGFRQDANEIDHDISALNGAINRGGIAEIGLNGVNLPNISKWLQEKCEIGAAYCNPHPVPALGQRTDDMAADET